MTKSVIFILCFFVVVALLIALGFVLSKLSERLSKKSLSTALSTGEERIVKIAKGYCKYGGYTLSYGVLVLICFTCLFPFFWMITSSLKTPAETSNPVELIIFPSIPKFDNYARAWERLDVMRSFGNTMIIEVATIPVCVFMSSMEAFAFSKMYMKHKTVHLLTLLSGLMIPYVSVVLPLYRVYYSLGFINTFLPLILPNLFGSVAQMFFYIQYQKGIPDAMFESGKIDGAGYFQQFIHLMLPMMGPAIAAQVVFMFIGNWNDFFAPSLYLTSENVLTLQLKLKALADGNKNDLPYLFAGATITCIPLFIIYFTFQKYFVGGLAITGTGVKG
ncbi:MAG: carbohydrate ABC transporter permease [Clostridia bacterium]|nr:carbohydrate ABC transporter permease [Clostridia bacterium]